MAPSSVLDFFPETKSSKSFFVPRLLWAPYRKSAWALSFGVTLLDFRGESECKLLTDLGHPTLPFLYGVTLGLDEGRALRLGDPVINVT